MFALIDCNNFYASCERLFHPEWNNRPIIVLSNNDGCVIARSEESKALGIPMGAPYFQCKQQIDAHDIIVCSSNYALYGDLSDRVMSVLQSFSPDFQIYSVDEAFLHLPECDFFALGKKIKDTVFKWTGIPVSIGMGPTKTLAKTANYIAKKNSYSQGVFILDDKKIIDPTLDQIPVGEVWGIGKKSSQILNRHGIQTALQLKHAPDAVIKKHLTVFGLRTAWELKGISCLPLELVPSSKKSITYSRSFGAPTAKLSHLQEAIATYAAAAGEKMRRQRSLATSMLISIEQHPFNRSVRNKSFIRITFPQPTNYTPHLIHHARTAIQALYRSEQKYRKAGVLLDGLIPENHLQTDLFTPLTHNFDKQKKLMSAVDQLNKKYGRTVVRSAAEGFAKEWQMKRLHSTPRHTSQWNEILTIQI